MGEKVLVNGRLIDVAEETERILREGAQTRTLADLRHKGYVALKVMCTRCWHEGVVRLEDIPRSRDRWPLKWLKFPHASCPATGAAFIRVVPIK